MSNAEVAALFERGVAQQRAGQHRAAIQIFHLVRRRGGASAALSCRLGESYERINDFEQADAAYFEAIELDRDCDEAYLRAADLALRTSVVADRVGQSGPAGELRQAAFRYLNSLGIVRVGRGAWRDAEAAFRKARALAPQDWAVHVDHGRCLSELGRHQEAEAAIRVGMGLQSGKPLAHYYLGLALRRRGRPSSAEAELRQALALDPDLAAAHAELGNALFWLGRTEEAEAAFARARALQMGLDTAERGLYLTGPIYGAATAAQIFERHVAWAAMAMAGVAPTVAEMAPFANSRAPDRRLRVGFVSPDFREHSVAYFVEPLLAQLDRAAIETVCYADVWQPDETTARLRRLAAHWRPIAGLSDAGFRRTVRQDAIDILVELAGHTDGNRLSALTVRPAPVTVSWLGYPATTGLTTIDWRITDAAADPPGAEAQYTEQLIRLPGGFLCYRPADDAPGVAAPPAVASGVVTFGSFNNALKVTPAVVAAWAAILKAVPDSRLLIKTLLMADEAVRQRLSDLFAAERVDPGRLDLRSGLRERTKHLATYGEIDIGLDTFPYNGTTTTCEALWMGVPVVTLAGDRHSGRVGLDLLGRIGLDDLIAPDLAAYIDRVVRLAGDIPALAAARAGLRQRVAASSLCDGRRFAGEFAAALRQMWRDWLAKGEG